MFIQNKLNKKDLSTNLDRQTIQQTIKQCETFLKESCEFPSNLQLTEFENEFVLILIARREHVNENTRTIPPTNIIFCFEDEVEKVYDPSLVPFGKSLILRESTVVNSTIISSSSQINEENENEKR